MCGYLCTGCGRCKGELKGTKPFGTCLACGAANPAEAAACSRCGAPLVPPPGAVLAFDIKKRPATK